MCGCAGKPVGTEGYTKTRSGLLVRNDRISLAAMRQYGVENPTYVDGVMRWAGIDWYGVPYPVRLGLVRMGKLSHQSKLPGCGCVKVLKDAWESVSLMFNSTKDHLCRRIRLSTR